MWHSRSSVLFSFWWWSQNVNEPLDGNIFTNITYVTGKQGKALYTNGVDQWVNLGNQRDKCLGNLTVCREGFVIAMWLKMHRGSDYLHDEYFVTSGGHTKGSVGVACYRSNRGRIVAVFRNETRTWQCRLPLKKGVWYHIVMTWQKGERVIFYLNGCIEKIVAKGVSEDNNQDGGDNDFVIGSTNRDSKKSTYTAQMTLDELRVWDAAMSPGDVWAIYAADAFK